MNEYGPNEKGQYKVGRLFETIEGVNNSMERFFRRGAVSITVDRVNRDDGLRFELTAWFETEQKALNAMS